MSLAAYRSLLRSARLAFQGDLPLLRAAQDQARAGFRQNAGLASDDPTTAEAIKHAEEVSRILRENIVQGKLGEGDRYTLRIHEHTERGDNDSVKFPNGQQVKIGSKCCSS